LSRVSHQKKKSNKGKETLAQSPLEKTKQTKKTFTLLTHKRVEIIPIYGKDQMQSYCNEKTETGVKIIRDDGGIKKIVQEEVKDLGGKLSQLTLILDYKALGKQIAKFIETNDPQLAVDTIRKYPWVIFDDGTQILQSLLIALPEQEFSKILSYFKGSFWNPIRDQILRWQSRTQKGIPQEQKEEAEKLLEKAGLGCFIIKTHGRPKKELSYSLVSLIREYKTLCREFNEFLKRNYKEYVEQRDGPSGPFLYLKVGDNLRLLNEMVNRFIKEHMGADFYIRLDRKSIKITNTAHDLVKHILAMKYGRDYYTIEKDLTDRKAKYIEENYTQS
jgi:hypothetical protein